MFAAGELWKRGVYNYVHEARRRNQLLLVRRIVIWAVALAIIGINFATEASSFATFAGLLTAGIAVAMQSVLVSIVGYFFLIGKYGLRVGDHVQIGNVSGEVIDIGLVRLHLMEHGPQHGPTGRMVALANSVVFQAAGGIFKQIPGVSPRVARAQSHATERRRLLVDQRKIVTRRRPCARGLPRRARAADEGTPENVIVECGGKNARSSAAALLVRLGRCNRSLSRAAAARGRSRRAHVARAPRGAPRERARARDAHGTTHLAPVSGFARDSPAVLPHYRHPTVMKLSDPRIASPAKVSPVKLASVSRHAIRVAGVAKCSTRSVSPSPSTSDKCPRL